MDRTTAHIINHTHWDREWFLTSVYTSQWIAGLIDKLSDIVEQNPEFHFFLDGQTLVIEDLLQIHSNYRVKVDKLIRSGNLLIGPYYCQPDWRMTGAEALLRNLHFGWKDMQKYGGGVESGWLVDTFGHISQSPQIHNLFGIDSVYIWRGASQMEPYFNWHSPGGNSIFTINLFGGYRNLYGVTHVPEIAVARLQSELDKLAPYYPTPDIPLFDGYDLEDNPEDPVMFYMMRCHEVPAEIKIQEETPENFARFIQQRDMDLPSITGELISGKFGAVFPGTLSSRIYLKRMAHDCEHLLYQVCEPLAVLARQKGRFYPDEAYEAWGRTLLQNAVHDCICGVSIDQVHEKMEFSYREVYEALQQDLQKALDFILDDFREGTYAVSTNSYPYEGWLAANDKLYLVRTGGIGVWKIREQYPIDVQARAVQEFSWKNTYYEAHVSPDGTVQVGDTILGELRVFEEKGDTYSCERGSFLGLLQPKGSLHIEQESEKHCVLKLDCSFSLGNIQVTAVLHLTFDPSPLIQWQVEIDGQGTDYQVEMIFETAQSGQVFAGMPFDIVQRPTQDGDLLPRQLDDQLNAVLLGQRELTETRTFPFHDFVAVKDGSKTTVVFAQGLHAYEVSENGQITLPLNRAVEWLTKSNLEGRVGDAGPFFYVPDARCERTVIHQLAVFLSDLPLTEDQIVALNAGFQNPPLLVETNGEGEQTEWLYLQESLPLSSMHAANGRFLARLFNPTHTTHLLSQSFLKTDVFGHPLTEIMTVGPKEIVTLSLGEVDDPLRDVPLRDAPRNHSSLLTPPAWNVGENQGLPDPLIIQKLKEKIAQLERQVEDITSELPQSSKKERYLLQHRLYVLQREALEYKLSARLNEIKLAMQGRLTFEYLYKPDKEIAAIGKELNQLRIKRRIYDYVIQAAGALKD